MKYLCGSRNKSWMISLFFLTSFSRGYTGAPFMKQFKITHQNHADPSQKSPTWLMCVVCELSYFYCHTFMLCAEWQLVMVTPDCFFFKKILFFFCTLTALLTKVKPAKRCFLEYLCNQALYCIIFRLYQKI